MEEARPFCSEVSAENREPLVATASRIDHWLLVEYRGVWPRGPLAGSGLAEEVKAHLARQLGALARSRFLFIRRPDRRHQPRLVCFFGTSRERASSFFRIEVDEHERLLDLDLAAAATGDGSIGEPVDHPLLIVCTHGKRDRCCALYGRPLYDALRDQADETWVWQASHVGGDRFAGNLVCLPEGLYYGRVAPADVWSLLDEHLAGRIDLDRFRGRCCYPFPAQAAEQAIRVETGLRGIDDLELAGSEARGNDAWRVRFVERASGRAHERRVTEEEGQLTYLTCSAATLRHPRHFVVQPAEER